MLEAMTSTQVHTGNLHTCLGPVADIALELKTLQELVPGCACKQSGPALGNFAGEHSHRLHPALPFFEWLLWHAIRNMGPNALPAAG